MNYRDFCFNNSNYIISKTIKTYSRTASGKSWKSKPDAYGVSNYKPGDLITVIYHYTKTGSAIVTGLKRMEM